MLIFQLMIKKKLNFLLVKMKKSNFQLSPRGWQMEKQRSLQVLSTFCAVYSSCQNALVDTVSTCEALLINLSVLSDRQTRLVKERGALEDWRTDWTETHTQVANIQLLQAFNAIVPVGHPFHLNCFRGDPEIDQVAWLDYPLQVPYQCEWYYRVNFVSFQVAGQLCMSCLRARGL